MVDYVDKLDCERHSSQYFLLLKNAIISQRLIGCDLKFQKNNNDF